MSSAGTGNRRSRQLVMPLRMWPSVTAALSLSLSLMLTACGDGSPGQTQAPEVSPGSRGTRELLIYIDATGREVDDTVRSLQPRLLDRSVTRISLDQTNGVIAIHQAEANDDGVARVFADIQRRHTIRCTFEQYNESDIIPLSYGSLAERLNNGNRCVDPQRWVR